MSKSVNSKILIRRDTTTNWSTNNPTLAAGEIGFDVTVGKHKIGDGSTTWNNLPYFALESDLQDYQTQSQVNALIQAALADLVNGDNLEYGDPTSSVVGVGLSDYMILDT